MKTLMLILVVALVLAVSGTASASQGTTITINPPGVTLLPGSTVTYEMTINTLPAGLSGYQLDFQLTNPGVGQITQVTFPSWAKLSNTSSLPAGRVTISAVDLGKAIDDGAAGTTLARVTVEAKAAGTSNVKIQNLKIDDDHGGYINPDTTTAQLIVKPGGVSVTTQTASPNTTVIMATPQATGAVTSQPVTSAITPLGTAAGIPVVNSVTENPRPDTNPGDIANTQAASPASMAAKVPRWALYAVAIVALVSGLLVLFLAVSKRI